MTLEDHFLKCSNCGYQSNIDPALMDPDSPMQYCPECDEPLVPPGDIEPTHYWNGYEWIKNDLALLHHEAFAECFQDALSMAEYD